MLFIDCDPTVEIDFMGEQKVGSQAYVRYFPETLINGSGIGYFNGVSHLEVPYFIDGKDMGTLYLHMEFKVNNAGPNRQVLVSNCRTKETRQASFQVLLDRQQKVLLILGYTYESYRILEIPFEVSYHLNIFLVSYYVTICLKMAHIELQEKFRTFG